MAKHDGYKFWREKLNEAKFILAPMVEQSELPWRILSRKYCAQLCYTPMMHAGVFVRDQTYRSENFVTCSEDRPLIAQFCSDDPNLFSKAAKMIENECDAIDLNLGCPQNIAKRGHYGSFLQDEWQLIHEILSKAVAHLNIPVTAKIRVFEDIGKTVEYAKMIESTGISILTVHGRTREQKGANTGLASWEHIKAVKINHLIKRNAVKIPVFANGNILCFNDVIECLKQTGCDGVMVAEPNLFNPALFAAINPCTWDIAYEYMLLVEKYPCSFACIRGHLFKIFQKVFERHTDLREKMSKLKSIEGVKEAILEIKEIILKEQESKETKNIKTDNGLDYWLCQSHLRPILSDELSKERENIKKVVDEKISDDPFNSTAIKRHIDELNLALNDNIDKDQQESTLKYAKILERKKRKLERNERKLKYIQETNGQNKNVVKKEKYVRCKNCKNPKGDSCEHSLCRKCCKDKVFIEMTECKGHGLKYRKKNEITEQANQNEDKNTLENKT